MNDRELLELAAKAAGYRVHGWINDRLYVVDPNRADQNFDPFVWSPLTDDGDALRLAVQCKIDLVFVTPAHDPADVIFVGDGETKYKLGTDPLATTRRAIVRAAAEIGRRMQHE